MAVAMIGPKFYAWDRNGKPLAFGKLYTYQARTNTPKDTYQSEDQVVPNTNPVILNGEGYADVYLEGSYKMVLKDDKDNEIWSSDPVSAAQATEWNLCLTATYVSPTKLKVAGNFVEEYEPNRRVRIDNNTTEYSYSTIVDSVYAAGETTITIQDAVVTTGVQEVCLSIVGVESFPSSLVGKYTSYEFKTLQDALDGITSSGQSVSLQEDDVCNIKERTAGNGGRGIWDVISGTSEENSTYIVEIAGKPLSLKLRRPFNNRVDVAALGGIADNGVTDNTNIVQSAIDWAHSLGAAETQLGDNWVGLNVEIPPNVAYNYRAISSFFNGSTDSSSATTARLINANLEVDELVGAFLWNTTDKSYGTIISNTVDTVTVKELYLGATNQFNPSDSIVISKHKVGVNIYDDSKFDWFNDSFTAQAKILVQCDAPHKTSANERHFAATYHPAYIVENQAPFQQVVGKPNVNVPAMEARGSFIYRHKNPEAKPGDRILDRYLQISMNSNKGEAEPKELNQIHVMGGIPYESFDGSHDGGNGVATLVDSTANWKVDRFVGVLVTNITDGSIGTITANTATTITANLVGGTSNKWDSGDIYNVEHTYDRTSFYSSEVFGVATHNPLDRRVGLGQRAQEGISVAQRNWNSKLNNIWDLNTPAGTSHRYVYRFSGSIIHQIHIEEEKGITGFGGRIDGGIVLEQYHNGVCVTNTENQGGTANVYLPKADAPEGFKVTITRTNAAENVAVRVSLLSGGGDQIFGTTGPDQLISATAIGDSITLVSDGNGVWYPSSIIGTWTFT